MKMLVCFLSYVSADLRLAGGTTHFIENLRRWSNSQTELRVLTTSDGAHLVGKLGIKCNLETVAPGATFLMKSSIGSAISLLLRVLNVLFRLDPRGLQLRSDAVCTESHFLPDILAALLVRRYCPRARLISYLHHVIPHPSGRRRYHALLPSVLSWAAQSISLGLMKHFGFYVLTFPVAGSQLLEAGFSPEKIRYITNGVDIEGIREVPVSMKKFDACFLGNAIQRKGVFDLPEVWRHVCNFMPEANLAIVGTGRVQDIARLQKNFYDKKLSSNVQFLGYLSEREKLATLKASGLFLFPSYEEGWGIAISEAMACGLPVVAYDLAAYRTAFRRGIVTVPLGSIREFANATIMLLKNERKRNLLGQEGKDQIEEYDLSKVAAAELGLIKEICH